MIGFSCAHSFADPVCYTSSLAPLAGDWIQNVTAAAAKWGSLGDWDTRGVKDLSHAFSTNRNQAGAYTSSNNNPKVANFVGTGIDKWSLASATTLRNTFHGAVAMDVNVVNWDVSKTTTLYATFYKARTFTGVGLNAWNVSACTTLAYAFDGANAINVDLGQWDVSKVTTLQNMMHNASAYVGTGLDNWTPSAATTLRSAFNGASAMNANLAGWNTRYVSDLQYTFYKARTFGGAGLNAWDVSSATTLKSTFNGASSMNAAISGWSVAKITNMQWAFFNTGLSTCNKRRIADVWASSDAFNTTTYPVDWAADKCPAPVPLTDTTFKEASCKLPHRCTPKSPHTNPSTLPVCGSIHLMHLHHTRCFCPTHAESNWPFTRFLTRPAPLPTTFDSLSGDWVNLGAVKATTKWSELGEWIVSGVKDFAYAFSVDRNMAGGMFVANGNPQAASFVGASLSKWITTSLTTLRDTFSGAAEMDADLSGWNVGNVITLRSTFSNAGKFAGVGLAKWLPSKITEMYQAFVGVTAMTSETKRQIADADAWACNAAFASSYGTSSVSDWGGGTCGTDGSIPIAITACGAGLGLTVSVCVPCVGGQFSAANDANPCVGHTISSCPANEGFTSGSDIADTSCVACPAGTFSAAGDRSPCTVVVLDVQTNETIGTMYSALADVTNTSLGTVLVGLANLSTTLGTEGANGGDGSEQAGKSTTVRTVMVSVIDQTVNFANLSDLSTLGALTEALKTATDQPADVTIGAGTTSMELAARFAGQSAAVGASPVIQQSLITTLSNSLEATISWESNSKADSTASTASTTSVPSTTPTTPTKSSKISRLVTAAIGNISQAQLIGASASTPPVIMQSRSIGVVSKRAALVKKQEQGREVLTIDLTAVSSADYAPLNSVEESVEESDAVSGGKVVIQDAPALFSAPAGSSSSSNNSVTATVDLQVTQWSAAVNPFNFDKTSFDDGVALDDDDVPTPSDLITFTLRYDGADLPESMKTLASPVVFAFPITVDPNITVSPSTTGSNTTCTITANKAALPDAAAAELSGRSRMPPSSSPPSAFYQRTSVEVNKTDLVDCAHWDVAHQRWKRDTARGSHCEWSNDCTTVCDDLWRQCD